MVKNIGQIIFADERTCSKFVFYGEGPGTLPDYIPEEHIPVFLGGLSKVDYLQQFEIDVWPGIINEWFIPLQVEIPEGGLVPKSCYMPEEQLEHLTLSEESIYKCVTLSRSANVS